MDEIVQAVLVLIKDGLNWQETLLFSLMTITTGLIVWVVVTAVANIIKVTIIAIENIFRAFCLGIKSVGRSLANVSSPNQPPKVQ